MFFHLLDRVLKVFLSRTAQRIPYMTSWRVLRLLGIILLIVCWFLVAWTSAVCQNVDRKMALIDVGYTPEGLQFSMCLLDRWDYMMAVGKPLLLLTAVICFENNHRSIDLYMCKNMRIWNGNIWKYMKDDRAQIRVKDWRKE